MSPDDLIDVGRALYGPTWQTAMASNLAVTDRKVRHWASGSTRIPDWVGDRLAIYCRDHAKTLAWIATRLKV